MPETVYVRVDATRDSGLGHFMRCLALAEAWLDTGGDATFLGMHDSYAAECLKTAGIARARFEGATGSSEDLAWTLASIPEGSAIVLDGYVFDFEYQQKLARHGTLLVIDDFGHLPAYAGSMLLNQSPMAQRVVYAQAPAARLLGPDYMLLPRSLSAAPVRSAPCRPARNLLVTMGGADTENVGTTISQELSKASADSRIRLVIGPLNPDLEMSKHTFADVRNVELCIAPADMAATLAWADLAISAAGTTALQLAHLGIPSVLIAIADNQYEQGAALDAAGAAVYLGPWSTVTPDTVTSVALTLANDIERLARMATAGQRLVDGRGASRVCAALAAAAAQQY